ncbi:MAG: FHA domain-containing protein [Proteobacteria bacterium]|nr:FHA domain-containing protein [Pseudomonadota bacterium]
MKIIITYESGSRSGTEQSFRDKQTICLGRHSDNDCVFTDLEDKSVSSFHAEIRMVNGRIYIVDLNSTNGMLVNGHWAEVTQLVSGDHVELGKDGPLFQVEFTAEPTDPPADPIAGPNEWKSASLAPRPSSSNLDEYRESSAADRSRFRSFPVSRANTPYHHHSSPPEEKKEPEKSDKKYGERTVGMLIQKALAQAGLARSEGTSQSTDYFEALIEKRVRISSRQLKKIVTIAVLILIIAGAGVGYYIYKNRSVKVYQTTQVNYGDAAGGSIASANRYTVFMLAGQKIMTGGQPGELQGFCTAFAVTRNTLATNAHCVHLANREFSRVIALMNGAATHRYPVVRTLAHPGYRLGEISPDVGLIRIQGQLSNLVTIAPATELGHIAPGATMFLYGFPGRLNREDAPEATFVKGDIGRVTTFEQRLGNFGENTLLQHSAFSSSGTSGSPIFNTSGHVIGINAGGYIENGKKLAGYNFAMRIDLINTLLPLIGAN